MSQRKKKVRVYDADSKLKVVQRMLAGESARELALELKVRRPMLYRWKDTYLCGGALALRGPGRPRQGQAVGPPCESTSLRGELLQARQRIAQLERKVGKQELELDFFAKALRCMDAALENKPRKGAEGCTTSSGNKPRKAD